MPSSTSTTPINAQDSLNVRTSANLEVSYFANENLPMLNQYIRRNLIGKGKHGKVHLCEEVIQRKEDQRGGTDLTIERKLVAMKTLKRQSSTKKLGALTRAEIPKTPHMNVADRLGNAEATIRKEIAVMKKLRHPHVVRLLEVIDDRLKNKVYLVMEYCDGGEVKWREMVNGQWAPTLTTFQTRRIMRDVLLALEYLHFQGIIHRDIKPQNLLWNADRSLVKICDFGVSHFSYAQLLAAAGAEGARADEHDPVLLDDSDLAKRAGTPNFVAPEVVYEHTLGFDLNDPKPPITKAVDIWSLGCTLYCLLFGDLPFRADGASEFYVYNLICNEDWPAPATAGCDQVPIGGRHPTDEQSEGWQLVHLLDHMLDKDMHTRITLPEVKRSPWLMRDVESPQQWLRDTAPNKIEVTPAETETALTGVRFRWRWGAQLTRHISTLFRNVRPSRSRGDLAIPPHVNGMSATLPLLPRPSRSGLKSVNGKRPASATAVKKLIVDVGQRSKSIERYSKGQSSVTTYVSSDIHVPRVASGSVPSSQGSPTEDRSTVINKSRFSLIHPRHWRSSRSGTPTHRASTPSVVGTGTHSPASRIAGSSALHSPTTPSSPAPSSHDAGNGGGMSSRARNSSWLGRALSSGGVRRSEEALRGQGGLGLGASLTAAKRASSFGDNRVEAEVVSLNSDDADPEERERPRSGGGGGGHGLEPGSVFKAGGFPNGLFSRIGGGGYDVSNGLGGADELGESGTEEGGTHSGCGGSRIVGTAHADTDWDARFEGSVLDGSSSSLSSTLKAGNVVSEDNLLELLSRPSDANNPYGFHYQHRIAELERERRLKELDEVRQVAERERETRAAQRGRRHQQLRPQAASSARGSSSSHDHGSSEHDEMHQDDIGIATREGSAEDDGDFYHDDSDEENEPLSFDTTRRRRGD